MTRIKRWFRSTCDKAHETIKWLLSAISAAATLAFVAVLEAA